MNTNYYFPFGEELKKVEQKDRTPKKVFVLGVYASAVHARWLGPNGKEKVKALAVASEPEIFWRGEDAEDIISRIKIPKELGKLTIPSVASLNGPSGKALDDLYLKPLGYSRSDAWLCDLLPESRVNENQCKAIYKHYTSDIIIKYDLAQATIPIFNKSELESAARRLEILNKLEVSKADTLILLGDLPIKWFLKFYFKGYSKLSDFGERNDSYGCGVKLILNNNEYNVIALCHPRQAAGLGKSNAKWGDLHNNWMKKCNKL